MKNISIKIIDRSTKIIKKIPYVIGEINIGDFSETFDMPIESWKIKDYEQQWQAGLDRLKDHDKSCLVTEAFNLNLSPLINWWLIYKENNMLYIRNHVLFQEYYEDTIGNKPFTPETCFNFIGPKTPNYLEDGRQVSEWVIPFE